MNQLIQNIERNGYQCTGKPEPLKENLSSWWSCRIDEKNRLVFRLKEGILEIIACKGHYD
ncbi:MAG: Txe/YoeB family addiction module toxin [Proteobacteria bacterium]|nr:Txe/YoeB family addiction module toxin [Pseudomonadota bacterium]MCL2307596.1 Txe/YoeB family addiction module toxin [Pseudomonadota bacterium]